MIIGIGVDLVEIHRVKVALEKPQFIKRVFTQAESEYCLSRGRQAAASFAARFAGKEALMKALGTGLASGGTWLDIEILPDEKGRPEATLQGAFAQIADSLGVTKIHISLSHAQEYAIAEVVLAGRDPK